SGRSPTARRRSWPCASACSRGRPAPWRRSARSSPSRGSASARSRPRPCRSSGIPACRTTCVRRSRHNRRCGHGTSGNVATPSTVGVIWSRSCLMRQVGAAGRGRRGVVTMEPQQTTSSLCQPLPLTAGRGSSLPQGDPDLAPPQGDPNPLAQGDPDLALPQGDPDLALPQGDPDLALPQGDPDAPGTTSADCVQSLQRIEGLLAGRMNNLFRPYGLSTATFNVILVLSRAGGSLSPCDIGEQLWVTRGTVTGLLDSLERQRLVRRTPHPKDRRMLLIELTDEGRNIL